MREKHFGMIGYCRTNLSKTCELRTNRELRQLQLTQSLFADILKYDESKI